MEVLLAGETAQGRGQGIGGQGAGGHDRDAGQVQVGDFLPDDLNQGLLLQGLGDVGRKGLPVHRQGPARRHPGGRGRGHDQGTEPAHLLLEQAHGAFPGFGPERIAAHQFPQQGRAGGPGKISGASSHRGAPGRPGGPPARRPRCPPARRR